MITYIACNILYNKLFHSYNSSIQNFLTNNVTISLILMTQKTSHGYHLSHSFSLTFFTLTFTIFALHQLWTLHLNETKISIAREEVTRIITLPNLPYLPNSTPPPCKTLQPQTTIQKPNSLSINITLHHHQPPYPLKHHQKIILQTESPHQHSSFKPSSPTFINHLQPLQTP